MVKNPKYEQYSFFEIARVKNGYALKNCDGVWFAKTKKQAYKILEKLLVDKT